MSWMHKQRTERKKVAVWMFIIALMLCTSSFAGVNTKTLIIEATPNGRYVLPKVLINTHIFIRGNGKSDRRFVVTGAEGKSELKGDSFIVVSGSYITFSDIRFLNNEIRFSESEALISIGSKKKKSNEVSVVNCEFIYNLQFNDLDMESQFFWIKLHGNKLVVDSCRFAGKQNRLPIVHVDANGMDNKITNSLFGNVKERKRGALEAIRIGLANGPSNCRVEGNMFEDYHGDSETISVKADGVVLVNNRFINCRSGISLRAADNCVVANNEFIKTTWPLRISGANHLIENNFFNGGKIGSITLMVGGKSYRQVSNLKVDKNVFVDVACIRVLQQSASSLFPKAVVFNSNLLYNSKVFELKSLKANTRFGANSRINKLRKDGITEHRYILQAGVDVINQKLISELKEKSK
jgi:parallel beta-helix repeat protein